MELMHLPIQVNPIQFKKYNFKIKKQKTREINTKI